ncbi:uncharacterized protein LOC144582048 [Callithrix jacchus]
MPTSSRPWEPLGFGIHPHPPLHQPFRSLRPGPWQALPSPVPARHTALPSSLGNPLHLASTRDPLPSAPLDCQTPRFCTHFLVAPPSFLLFLCCGAPSLPTPSLCRITGSDLELRGPASSYRRGNPALVKVPGWSAVTRTSASQVQVILMTQLRE